MLWCLNDILITPEHWMLILKGLGATVVITVLALALGTLLGAGIYAMSLNRRRWVRETSKVYRTIMRGTPVLILLLVVFYVVLGGHNGILAAVLAFALNFSTLAYALILSSFDTVGRGQMEAGRALGLTPMQNLRYVVLPQALHNALPAFKFQAAGLAKSTSVVGYVAIQDITKAAEAIRTDSGQSLIPLLIVTVIYFILTWALNKGLDQIVKNINRI